MPRLKTSTKFFHWVIGLSVTALMIAGYWISPSLTNRIELLLQDAHFHWRGPAKPGPEVVIAAIDEKSLDELGRWPWPRVMLTRLVDKLVQLDAKVIGFDVIFASPDESSGLRNLRKIREEAKADGLETPRLMSLLDRYIGESDYDAQFAAALRRSRRAVLGFFLHYTSAGLEHLQNEALQANLRSILSSRFRGFIKSSADIDLASLGFRSAYTVESNIPIISQSVRNAGHISFDADPDGSLRKLPLIVKYHDEPTNRDYFFPPLSIPILEKFLRGTFLFRVNEFGIQKVLLDAAEPVEIPTNEKGELYINFLGARGSFPYFSITDIIHDREDLAPKKSFKDKIVLVGATATALEDLRVTPFDPILPGVEIHATIIDNILRKNYLYQPDWIPAADSAYLLILGFVLTFLFSRIKPLYAPLASVAAAAAQFYVHHWIFINKGFWISNVFPLLENVLILAGLMIYRHIAEEKQKQYIEKVFKQYLSPSVIEQLLKDPNKLKLGGEQKELTALFTDVAGFTTVSEKLSPEELVNFLNNLLTEMTDILIKYEGTLDKYDGDAIKAFFGAPIYFEDHARRSCWVCVEMQERLKELRKEWKSRGLPEFFMRIGINTGLMVVGNMGSASRMNYGMNGDSVNLAARLEGANKQYKTFSMISESTYQQAKDFIEVRELDSIRVIGRKTPVKVYELLGKAGQMDEGVRAILPFYNQGLEFYKAKQWGEALDCFAKALERRPEDGPSLTYFDRCKIFKEKPPPEDWDGVFVMPSK